MIQQILFILVIYLTLTVSSHQCQRTTIRKEVHDLSPQEIDIFKLTIRRAMNTADPYAPSKNMWEASALFHSQQSSFIHGGAEFFFWHRKFVSFVERKLQAINPEFAFPYWDSSRESSVSQWQKSLALEISSLADVLDTRRKLEPYDLTYPQQWSNLFDQSIKTGQGFNYWAPIPQAEYLHGTEHVNIGGRAAPLGEMSLMTSPRDPIFYMHHAFIDYLWVQGQVMWSNQSLPQVGAPLVGNKGPSSMTSPLPGFGNTFGDVVDSSRLCVEYAPFGSSNVATFRNNQASFPSVQKRDVNSVLNHGAYGDRINIALTSSFSSDSETIINNTTKTVKVGPCVPLSSSWTQMMGISQDHVQKALDRCQAVRENVKRGIPYPTIPSYSAKEYQKAMDRIVSGDIGVSPLIVSKPMPIDTYTDANIPIHMPSHFIQTTLSPKSSPTFAVLASGCRNSAKISLISFLTFILLLV